MCASPSCPPITVSGSGREAPIPRADAERYPGRCRFHVNHDYDLDDRRCELLDPGDECSMGGDRKRSPPGDLYQTPNSYASASSSSAAYARHTFTNRSSTLPPPPRTNSSPPASAYFTHFANDDTHVLEPTSADATSHFAYSTTLRRHYPEGPLGFPQTPRGAALPNFGELRTVVAEEGAAGLFQRTVQSIKSLFSGAEQDYERLPVHKEEAKDTPSARFAHCSVEVSAARTVRRELRSFGVD